MLLFIVAPLDYRAVSQVLVFNTETIQHCVDVFALADVSTENDESFTLALSSLNTVQFSPQAVNVTLQNIGKCLLFFLVD